MARSKRGETDAALEDLRAIANHVPASVWRLARPTSTAIRHPRAGRDREALNTLTRFQAMYLPRMMWRSWALRGASCLSWRDAATRLGERDRAREH